jgi:hypothetical protein
VTPGPPSPRPVAITVARVDGSTSWPRFRTDAARTGGGWMRLDDVLGDEAALDDWYRTELAGTARGHADLAGALIVYRVAGALAELVVAALADQRRALPLAPAGVSLRFGGAGRLDEVGVAAPGVTVLTGDPAAGEPGTRPVTSADALRATAVDGLVAVFAPLADAVRARAPFGRPGMWGTLADHVAEAAVRRARDRGADVEAAWAEASGLIDDLAARQPLLRSRPRREDVPVGEGVGTVVAKGTCCLIYKAAGPPGGGPDDAPGRRLIARAACTSCPLRSPEDRAARFAAWLSRR